MRVLLAVLLLVPLLAPVARADTIVFRRGTDVWRMAPDGSGQAPLTAGEARYEWPSVADDGTVVAADEAGRLHRLTLTGTPLGAPIPTAATLATEDAPAETPTHVRVSPDGARIAYDEVVQGSETVLWTPATATGLELPGQSAGQTGMSAPAWIGSGTLLVSREVLSEDPGATFLLYAVGQGDDSAVPWFSDEGAAWATGFDAVASRDGRRIAVVTDDAAEHDGTPTRVALRLFDAAAPGAPPALRCELALEAGDTYPSTSPAFSPDGTQLAWAESDGIHVAALGDCGAIRERVVTLPGAWEPSWSRAEPPAAAEPAPLALAVSTRARPLRATLRRHGLRVRVTVGAPATVRLTLRAGGRVRTYTRTLANAGTTTVYLRVGARVARRATRLVLRTTAPGAAPVTTVVRPRAS